MDTGLIHIYCGNGKGKTTASLGLAIRCAGWGGHIIFAQFLKGRDTGELHALEELNTITVIRSKGLTKFTFQMTPQELTQTKKEQEKLWDHSITICHRKKTDMIILDEIISAIDLKLISESVVLQFLKTKPKNLEVVMTGRNPSPELLKISDYVSEIVKRKHPFDKGIEARKGIEK